MTAALKLFREGKVLSIDQEAAVDAVDQWFRTWPIGRQYFTLAGMAGTGKTTVVGRFVGMWNRVAVVAPTGKAVNRLKEIGIDGAQTVHSLIYVPYEDLSAEDRKRKIRFKRRKKIEADTIICDEASMINQMVLNDLLAFGKPVLFVGDHGQLEPIGANPGLMKSPDFVLEKIHRQAMGNPVIRLAAAWREGREEEVFAAVRRTGTWATDRCVVTRERDFDAIARSGHQIICGFNATRHRLNQAVRQYRDLGGPLPLAGERIVCLQNNASFGVFNGQQADIIEAWKPRRGVMELAIRLDDGEEMLVPASVKQFGADCDRDDHSKDVTLWDWAYAVTCHKAQGSEWDGVIVLDEVSRNWNAPAWRYTATTRAKQYLRYCL